MMWQGLMSLGYRSVGVRPSHRSMLGGPTILARPQAPPRLPLSWPNATVQIRVPVRNRTRLTTRQNDLHANSTARQKQAQRQHSTLPGNP